MEQKQAQDQGTELPQGAEPVQNTAMPNPGVPIANNDTTSVPPEASTVPQMDTSVPVPDPAPELVEDKLSANDLNPIEERVASQNSKYMIIVAVVAVVIIVLALMYMWGSQIAERNEVVVDEQETILVGEEEDATESTVTPPSTPTLPPSPEPSDPVPSPLDDIDVSELDTIDAEIDVLEAEIESVLGETGAL
jgi:hypothetical protein